MKHLFLVAVMAITMSLGMNAENKTAVFSVNPKMSCQNCENKIKGNLRYEKGIKNIETSLANQTVTVTYDEAKTNPEAIVAGFKKIGYAATEGECQSNCPSGAKTCCKNEKACNKEAKACTGECKEGKCTTEAKACTGECKDGKCTTEAKACTGECKDGKCAKDAKTCTGECKDGKCGKEAKACTGECKDGKCSKEAKTCCKDKAKK